jgi:hypothetical protein
MQRKKGKRGLTWFHNVRLASLLPALAMIVISNLAPLAHAQAPVGSIEGVVTDSTGAVIPGAKITVTDLARGRVSTFTASASGAYSVEALSSGQYQVKVEAPSFKTGILTLTVQIAKVTSGDISLQAGSVSETVNVTTNEQTAIDTNTDTVNGSITAKEIETLPLNGRNFLDVAQLQPGVQVIDGGNFDPTKNGFAGVSVAGGSGRTTRIQVDGLDITDENVGTTVMNVSLDSVQEFQISQSGLDPSTSLSNTGAIDISTKTGSNAFHGTAFMEGRDSDVAARIGPFEAPFHRYDGGASGGGPAIKDKLFWFLNYETNHTQNSTILDAPSPFDVFNGPSPSPFVSTQATGRVDWNAKEWAHVFFRFSHDFNQLITGYGGDVFSPFQNQDNTNAGVIGADLTFQHFTHSFRVGRVNFANYINPNTPPGLPNIPIGVDFVDSGATFGPNLLAPQHTLSTSNQFRYDGSWIHGNHTIRYGAEYNRVDNSVFAAFFAEGPVAFTSTGDLAAGAPATSPLSYDPEFIIFGNGLGFFSNLPSHGYPFGGVHNHRVALYAADSWKARHNLTLNFGLRWEVDPGQVNRDLARPAILDTVAPGESGQEHLDLHAFAPSFGFAYDISGKGTTVIRGGAGIYFETNINNNVIFERADLIPNSIAPGFPTLAPGEPLLGPSGDLILNFNTISGMTLQQALPIILAAQSTLQAQAQAATKTFPNGPLSILPPGGLPGTQNTGNPLQVTEYREPYSIQTNIGVQHKLGNNWMVQADYVRNRGLHLFLVNDYNDVGAARNFNKAGAEAAINGTLSQFGVGSINQAIAAGATINDFINNGLGFQSATPGVPGAFPGNNPNFGQLNMIGDQGTSAYDALLVRLNGRTGEFHGFVKQATWMVSYALSRFTSTQDARGDEAFAPIALDNLCVTCFNGQGGVDRTNQFTINTNWDFAWGFHITTLTHWQSALPNTLLLPTSSAALFQTDYEGSGALGAGGTGTGQEPLPGTNIGSYGRGINSVAQLNAEITSFNQNFAGKLTPAGQKLVSSGLFTFAQMQALGGVIQPLPLAPAGQVLPDSFWDTDLRFSKMIRVRERVQIEPYVDCFNVFNKHNWDAPPSGVNTLSGTLSGTPGTVNGTLYGERANAYGLNAGSFSPGIPRQFQFGLRVSW